VVLASLLMTQYNCKLASLPRNNPSYSQGLFRQISPINPQLTLGVNPTLAPNYFVPCGGLPTYYGQKEMVFRPQVTHSGNNMQQLTQNIS
jgi:hypothetical protein